MNTQSLNFMAMFTALILVLGLFFEVIVPTGYFATYIKMNPFEGILLIPLVFLGFIKSFVIVISYILLLLFFKGISAMVFIEILALLLSIMTLFTVFYFFYKKTSLIIALTISTLVNTIVMVCLNALFITPSYLNLDKQLFSFYYEVFLDKSFIEVLWFISTPLPLGGGILHGSIMKYGLVSIVGYVSIKTFKKYYQK